MFSVGVLYSSQTLLEVVDQGRVDSANFATSFARIGVADGKVVLETAQNCRWLRILEDGAIRLTERGGQLRSIVSPEACLREQLYDVLMATPPAWSRKMVQGRFEALQAMPDDTRQCFKDCGLTDGSDDDTVTWWDRATSSLRSERSRLLNIVGRRAEKLSLGYERLRTGKEPLWQGFETNRAGFDVLSVVDATTDKRLKIEVKGSSMRKSEASFFVTRNEWNTATTSNAFQFHLWLVRDSAPKLFVVPAGDVKPHIPVDSGSGQWTGAELFFRDFGAFEIASPSPTAVMATR
ncbi:DUF3883 domain-containing protein [Bradyrhizobium sp.]|uniref:protein NO VEIN domain-containing protein n=1 Tax=Bradyrhizobium sp. TaxID=376 RepID=UPI00261A0EF7|nr:DUF3883 domain-containing protein [Bradyrhizobium sp.]